MKNERATREALGETLIKLGKENENIVALDADLAKSTTLIKFEQAFPERFFDCGVAEQNMMDIAAGLAACGKICFTGSFAIFATGRAFEQVRNTICYSNLNVKLCPTHAGVTVGADGSSHQSVEDIALMRAIPNMRVVVPADYFEAKAAIKKAAEVEGPFFIRLGRAPTPLIFDENYRFELGKSAVLKEGKDVSILATGLMLSAALEASKKLSEEGVEAEVVNISSIKPLDKETIINSATKTKAVVTAEEHTVIGGLGSAVAEMLAEEAPTRVVMLGLYDVFGQSGSAKELLSHFSLTPDGVVEAVKKVLANK